MNLPDLRRPVDADTTAQFDANLGALYGGHQEHAGLAR